MRSDAKRSLKDEALNQPENNMESEAKTRRINRDRSRKSEHSKRWLHIGGSLMQLSGACGCRSEMWVEGPVMSATRDPFESKDPEIVKKRWQPCCDECKTSFR